MWPQEFKIIPIIPIKKKSSAVKVLNRRIENKAKDFIGENKFGLRKGRETRDAIAVLRTCSPHTPDVSMSKGTRSTPAMMSEYLAILLSSAADAADQTSVLLS